MQTTKQTAAQMIRKELKEKFPTIKFSVRTNICTIRVGWGYGPSITEVEEITSKYEYSVYNAMEDIHENLNRREDIPQVEFAICQRSVGGRRYGFEGI